MLNYDKILKLFSLAICVCWCVNSEAVAGKLALIGTSAFSNVSPHPEGGFRPSGARRNIKLAQSTINPNIPAQGSALSSQPIRNNFQAAQNDINTLYGRTSGFVSVSAPNIFTAPQTFTNNDLRLLGSSLGYTTFASTNTSASNYTLSIPPITGTAAVIQGFASAANSVLTADGSGNLSLTTTLPAALTIPAETYSGPITWSYDGDQQIMGNADASQMYVGGYASATGTLAGLLGGGDFCQLYFNHNVPTPSNGVFTTTTDSTSTSYSVCFSDAGLFNIYEAPATGVPGHPPVFVTTPTFSLSMLTGVINNAQWHGTPISVAYGGTGQTTASASFNALSPMTTAGDIIYGGTGGVGTRLAAGTSSQVLIGGTTPSWGIVSPAAGGTGVANNAANTLTFTGAHPLGLTLSGPTTLTLPASGTLSTTLTTNTTLNVPGDYATVQAACAALQKSVINQGVTATIQVAAGIITGVASPWECLHPYGDRIQIIGATPTTTAISAIGTVTGSAQAYSVTLTVGSTTGLTANSYVIVSGTAGATGHYYHRGVWKVASITDGTHLVVTNTSNQLPPTGVTGTLNIFPTQAIFSGVSGVIADHLGLLSNIIIAGDGTAATFGIWQGDPTQTQPGNAVLGVVGVSGFVDGIRANYNGRITALSNVYSSGNTNNGFLSRDGGMISCGTSVGACYSSGNGTAAPAGGGNGYLAENKSAMLLENAQAYGNWGVCYYSRSSSSILSDTGTPSFAVGCNTGYMAQAAAFLQADSSQSLLPVNSGYYASEGGVIIAQGAEGASCGSDCFGATDAGSKIDATNAVVVTSAANGVNAQNYASIANAGMSFSGVTGANSVASGHGWFTVPVAVYSYVYSSTYSLATATGAVTVTGMPFKPTSCEASGGVAGSSTFILIHGESDSALNQNAVYLEAGLTRFSSGTFMAVNDQAGNYVNFVITAYNTGGLTLSATKGGSPTGTFSYTIRCLG